MRFILSSFSLLVFYTNSIVGQVSIKNPTICHDRSNYLKCFSDGSYLLKFEDGHFKQFETSDSLVKYSNATKTLTFYTKSSIYPFLMEKVQLKLLPKSVLIQKGVTNLEVTSLTQIQPDIFHFNIGTYSIDNVTRGLVIFTGDKEIKFDIWTYGKKWSWSIYLKENNQRLSIQYSYFKRQGLSSIFIQDKSLRYGMAIEMNYRSSKKIRNLYSEYTDSVATFNELTVIGSIPLDKYYYYNYNKMGKLRLKAIVGDLKLCSCD